MKKVRFTETQIISILAIEKFIRLRYRLLPYIYAVSRDVTAHQSTMMRALMMDFAKDTATWKVNYEYMFGHSMLVNQYATEKKWDDLEIYIYPGANGDFTLYEDENDNYNYEKGRYSEIRFHWDDKKRVVRIAGRSGSYDGMPASRKFIVVVAPAAEGKDSNSKTGVPVSYNGKAVNIKL